jgi:hypothetical protein
MGVFVGGISVGIFCTVFDGEIIVGVFSSTVGGSSTGVTVPPELHAERLTKISNVRWTRMKPLGLVNGF